MARPNHSRSKRRDTSPKRKSVAPTSQPRVSPQALPPVSVSALQFDASNAEVKAFAQSRGWTQPGQKITVYEAELVYTTDGWKTTRSARLQFVPSGSQAFLLRELPEGTPIEYAVHAHVGVTHDNFYSFDDRADFWANNGGQNYRGVVGTVLT